MRHDCKCDVKRILILDEVEFLLLIWYPGLVFINMNSDLKGQGLLQCFSTFFGSRHPFRLKKFGGTLMHLKLRLEHLKFDLDFRKFNSWRHPWHRLTAPLCAAAPRLGITGLLRWWYIYRKFWENVQFTKSQINSHFTQGSLRSLCLYLPIFSNHWK